MKKSAAAHLKVLSAMTADPIKAARAMLDTGKKHMKVTKKQISLNTIERLLKKQLGTEDVERMAMKVVKECGKRDVGFINFVMARRKQIVEKKVSQVRVAELPEVLKEPAASEIDGRVLHLRENHCGV